MFAIENLHALKQIMYGTPTAPGNTTQVLAAISQLVQQARAAENAAPGIVELFTDQWGMSRGALRLPLATVHEHYARTVVIPLDVLALSVLEARGGGTRIHYAGKVWEVAVTHSALCAAMGLRPKAQSQPAVK